MLSYRHSFHAGNFADILKHVILVEILDYMTQKETPFDYVDTHAGAGLFDLQSADANKTGEHAGGIGKLDAAHFPELKAYFDVIGAFNVGGRIICYPGSPSIAAHFMRDRDKAWLYELHPQDYKALLDIFRRNRSVKIVCGDGLQGLMSRLPPASRRGVALIDPSYEMKHDYEQVVAMVERACRKFATGVYAIWYPVVDRKRIDFMEQRLLHSGIKNIQRFELGIAPDSPERGMTSSGMFIINPPWTLFDKMQTLLPKLAEVLGEQSHDIYRCDVITSE